MADRPILAWQAGELLWRAAIRFVRRGDEPGLLTVAHTLSEDTSRTAAFLALAIARTAGERAGWTEEWRHLVRGSRTHDDPDVARAAAQVFTRVE